MKKLSTLLLFVFFSNTAFTQNLFQDIPSDVLKYFPHYSDLNPTNNSNHATLRAPFGLDSVHNYTVPQNLLLERNIHTYDNDGRDLGFTKYVFDELNNVWKINRRVETTYNSNGNFDVINRDNWIETNSAWQEDSRLSYSYDSNGNLLFYISELWDDQSQSLQNYRRYEFTYDNDNKRIEYNSFSWDSSYSQWKGTAEGFYFYNSMDLLEKFELNFWNELLNMFEESNQFLFEYNTDQYLTKRIGQKWNLVTNSYENTSQQRYTYDNFGNQIDCYYDIWATYVNAWDKINVRVNDYDLDNNLIVENFYNYNPSTGDYDANQRNEFFYTDLNLVRIKLLENISLNCKFQNPISVNQMIECIDNIENKNYHYSIVDISGRVLLENSFENNVSIQIPSIAKAGIYFLNIWQDETMMIREKIVIVD